MATAALVSAACSALGATTSPTPIPAPVTTPDAAIARVVAGEPRLTGIAPRDPNAIGQADWYDVQPGSSAGTFVVTTRIGWGDCQAHCINEHVWKHSVGADGIGHAHLGGGPADPRGGVAGSDRGQDRDPWECRRGADLSGRAGVTGSVLCAASCPGRRDRRP